MKGWTTVWYSVSDCEGRWCVSMQGRPSLSKIAEACADHHHSTHPSEWPRDIMLYGTEQGEPLASFSVELQPTFYATRKK